MLMFAYIVGGWVKKDAYVINEKMDFQKTPNFLPLKWFKSKAIILVLIMGLINVIKCLQFFDFIYLFEAIRPDFRK